LDIVLSVFAPLCDPAHTDICSLSLHDALPILRLYAEYADNLRTRRLSLYDITDFEWPGDHTTWETAPLTGGDFIAGFDVTNKNGDRKSTRLNSSHVKTSEAVFPLKKKNRYSME